MSDHLSLTTRAQQDISNAQIPIVADNLRSKTTHPEAGLQDVWDESQNVGDNGRNYERLL